MGNKNKEHQPSAAPMAPEPSVAAPTGAATGPQEPRLTPFDEAMANAVRNDRNHDLKIAGAFGLGGAGVVLVADLLLNSITGGGAIIGGAKPTESPTLGATAIVPATPTNGEAGAGPSNPDVAANAFSINSIISSINGDQYSLSIVNWHLISDNGNPAAVMNPDSTGISHVVSTLDTTVGQGYLDAKVAGEHQAISFVLAPSVTMPLRGITEWPLQPGQTPDQATEIAFEGLVNLESQTQPNVCTAEVTASIQALPENVQDITTDVPQWQAQRISAEQAAQSFGRDSWSMDPSNWSLAPDGYGMVLMPNPNGSNSTVEMTDAVGQAYLDAMVEGSHQAIAVTLAPGATMPVRGVTAYDGVPTGMEQEVTDFAHRQAVNLEIDNQPGVWVIKVEKTACPINTDTSVVVPETSHVSVPVNPEPTTVTMVGPTAKPEKPKGGPGKIAPWFSNIVAEAGKNRTELLPDGGIKVEQGPVITLQINGNEKIIYWNGTKVITQVGPATVQTGVASVYKN